MSAFADEFTKDGIATWNIEYRCIDNPGGGFPGTFLDVGDAIDYLRILAPKYNLDLENIIVIGHSSGGHLALWSAGRNKIKIQSPIHAKNPLKVKAAVNLAGHGDLRALYHSRNALAGVTLLANYLARQIIVLQIVSLKLHLMNYFNIKQIIIAGEYDVSAPNALLEKYVIKAKKLGDEAEFISINNSAHFDIIAPGTDPFLKVHQKVMNLFTGK